ncbi:hypothetical protein CDEST_07688 [Colletotrichum destructivum]|uniref:Uncharacterized protein n=1 Tax=Colletotrichum destructivum TaxID=34406 RepID=A0AAX4IIM9_9PEZI|nr:hypothetical protein CDEST_07688 [Colletotrichum destructivum]
MAESSRRPVPALPAEAILRLQPSEVQLRWGCTKPSEGLRECEIRLARETAAAAGFDLITIVSNIHPTTTRGTRRDKPHFGVIFQSSRYNLQTEQNVHINIRVWSPHFQQWTRYPSSGRPANYPYEHVHAEERIKWYRPLPRALAQEEIGTH